MKNMKLASAAALTAWLLATGLNPGLHAQGTVFFYSGQLDDSGVPANGSYVFRFTLFSSPSGPLAVAGPLVPGAIGVTNGAFTIPLDFGNTFDGSERWLGIEVRTNSNVSSFTALTPRVQILPTPYAIFAGGANAAGIVGIMPTGALSGMYANAITLTNQNNVFGGNGASLASVNASTLGGLSGSSFWQTGGNGGTDPQTQFLGTTDNTQLVFRVNNDVAMRYIPHPTAPSVLGGDLANIIAPGAGGAVVGGGGAPGLPNQVLNDHSVVGGGLGNSVSGRESFIGGGWGNTNDDVNSHCAVIGGGSNNLVAVDFGFIGGGADNAIQSSSHHSAISGGQGNTIPSLVPLSTIAGGGYNTNAGGGAFIGGGNFNHIGGAALFGSIPGGYRNSVNDQYAVVGGGSSNLVNAPLGTIAGGGKNSIQNSSGSSTISGGRSNVISAFTPDSTIAGGSENTSGGPFAAIGGGRLNAIGGGSLYATIPGGYSNSVNGSASFAAGKQAKALHNGAFVWSDGNGGTDFASSAVNQFLIHAGGNVGINLNNPSQALDVNGNVKATAFIGDGSQLTGVASSGWSLSGNTAAGGNFLGTLNNLPLELRANDTTALRLSPPVSAGAATPNLIGGAANNSVASGVYGAVIAGGGSVSGSPNSISAAEGFIGGGEGNSIASGAALSGIVGGLNNTIGSSSTYATIGGGQNNHVGASSGYSFIGAGLGNNVNSSYSSIVGGYGNTVSSGPSTIAGGENNTINSWDSFIGAGRENLIESANEPFLSGGSKSVIGGGQLNKIRTGAYLSFIGGGSGNTIGTNAAESTIAGGRGNTIQPGSVDATIAGGSGNTIQAPASTIGGGFVNEIQPGAASAAISGGEFNKIQTNAVSAAISGGDYNIIETNATYSAIGGGFANTIQTNASYATIPGGFRAKARSFGQQAYASGYFNSFGDAQTSLYVLRGDTFNGTQAEVFLDGATASRRMNLPLGGAWSFDILIVATVNGNLQTAGYQIKGMITRNSLATTLAGSPTVTILNEDVASWDATVEADNAHGALVIKVTGAADTAIRWVASVRTVEVVY
jgi:hypothetical protein